MTIQEEFRKKVDEAHRKLHLKIAGFGETEGRPYVKVVVHAVLVRAQGEEGAGKEAASFFAMKHARKFARTMNMTSADKPLRDLEYTVKATADTADFYEEHLDHILTKMKSRAQEDAGDEETDGDAG